MATPTSTRQLITSVSIAQSTNAYTATSTITVTLETTWNALIRGFSNTKNSIKSLHVFTQMLFNGIVPDYLTYPFLAKAFARISDLKLGGCVHGHVFRTGFASDLFISNSLIHMYTSPRDIGSAMKVFDEMSMRNSVSWNSVSWNSMLDGYAKCGGMLSMRQVFDVMPEKHVVSWSTLFDGYVKDESYSEALAVFGKMVTEGPEGNEVTMVSVLCACSHLGALEQGRATTSAWSTSWHVPVRHLTEAYRFVILLKRIGSSSC